MIIHYVNGPPCRARRLILLADVRRVSLGGFLAIVGSLLPGIVSQGHVN
jgi:hypothetical protein